ncbi:T9SS type A sorting domain-containing protein [Chitinophagaceae bacterium LWZ2-11]
MIILFTSMTLHAQNVTIDYTGNSLPKGVCNTFNTSSPATIGTCDHFPYAGGATANTNSVYLAVQSSTSTGANMGTAYAIKYNFKQNYKYTIKIQSFGTQAADHSYAVISASLFPSLSGAGNPTGCGAVAQNSWGGTQNSGNFLYAFNASSSSSSLTTIPEFLNTNAMQYLVICGHGTGLSNTTANSASIEKIIITETLPDFTLNPLSTDLQCGVTLSNKVFTVGNPYNIAGVTSYEWDLGSANNGWLYNGSPAPQNISTTANTLTLSSICGSAVSNVSVTVKVNNTNYKTYTSTTNNTLGAVTLTGADQICTGSQIYTLNNLPCNANVAWSATPAGIVSLSGSGSSVTVTKAIDGVFTLTADINACGYTTPPLNKYRIATGPYPTNIYGPYDMSFTNLVQAYSGQSYIFAAVEPNPAYPIPDYTWAISAPPGSNVFPVSGGSPISIFFDVSGLYTLSVAKTNNCGTSTSQTNVYVQEGFGFAMSVYPNPSSNSITVTTENSQEIISSNSNSVKAITSTAPQLSKSNQLSTINNKTINIDKINIYNSKGVLSKTVIGGGTQQMKLSISDLPNGIYFIEVVSGKKSGKKEIFIQH